MSSERRQSGGRGSSRGSHGDASRAPGRPPRAAAPLAAIDPADGARAAWVLVASVALLALLRTVAALAPSMHAWGFSALRFAAPGWGWVAWVTLPLAFIPAAARLLAPRCERWGDGLARGAMAPQVWLAALGVALVVAFPDRLWLMGDFLLRLGCTRGRIPVEIVFPQALPLDLLLHHHIPVALAHAGLSDPNHWERALGACEAAALVGFAAMLARQLSFRGMAAATCVSLVVFSGALGMFTGYGKAFVELTLATVAVAALALRVVREGRGAWALSLSLVVALLLHRSALALFVTLAAVVALWWRDHGGRAGRSRTLVLAAFATPVVAALLLSPIIIAAIRVTDLRHLAPAGSSAAAVVGAAFAPPHLLDIGNLIALGAPLALALPVLALALARPLRARSREGVVLAALVLPALAVLLFIHPRQGLFRDTDVFAPSLVALAVAGAALAGEALRGASTRAWVGVPVLLLALLSTVQSLSLSADVARGLGRVQAYLTGPPARPGEERALLWAYTAERYVGLGDSDAASAAFERAAELAPSPRILTEWALTEMDRRNFAGAQQVYRRAVERAPTYTDGWLGLANASIPLRDWAATSEALARASALEPDRAEVTALRNFLSRPAPPESNANAPPVGRPSDSP